MCSRNVQEQSHPALAVNLFTNHNASCSFKEAKKADQISEVLPILWRLYIGQYAYFLDLKQAFKSLL